MPAMGLLVIALQVLCAVHVVRTGRPYFWIFIIVFVPLLGMLVYAIAEFVPDLMGRPAARRTASAAALALDPGRALREALRRVEIAPTAANRAALGEAYLQQGRLAEAEGEFRAALVGILATDPPIMLGLARVLYAKGDAVAAQAELEALRAANPDYQSADGHLLYARSLEAQEKTAAALAEYAALVAYYPGQEARCRYGLLLRRAGRDDEAKAHFQDICRAIELGPRHQYREQRAWYDIAKAELGR
jgi:hypothetical protein